VMNHWSFINSGNFSAASADDRRDRRLFCLGWLL
jgi:hypothetical protein